MLLFLFYYNPSSGLNTRLRVMEGSDYIHSMYLFFSGFYWMIFFSHFASILRKWIVLQSKIFLYSIEARTARYLNVFLFLDHTQGFIITDMVVLMYYTFSISIARSLYLLILLCWLICFCYYFTLWKLFTSF